MNSENMSNQSSTKNFGKFQFKLRPADLIFFMLVAMGANTWGDVSPNNPAAPPPIFFMEEENSPCDILYSKPSQPRRTISSYADGVAQISSVGNIFR